MAIATIGAFALVLFPETEPHMAEGAAVMRVDQVGELFEEPRNQQNQALDLENDGHRPRLRERRIR